MEAKASLRRELLARRQALTPDVLGDAARALDEALAPLVRDARRLAAYASVGPEPPTDWLLRQRPDALLPVLQPDGDLDWAAGELQPGPRGLREPTGPRLGVDAVASCDLLVVPALAVGPDGARLGRGGGSYDRALRRATGLVVALLHDGELLEHVPSEPHDVRVQAVVTPSGGLVHLPVA